MKKLYIYLTIAAVALLAGIPLLLSGCATTESGSAPPDAAQDEIVEAPPVAVNFRQVINRGAARRSSSVTINQCVEYIHGHLRNGTDRNWPNSDWRNLSRSVTRFNTVRGTDTYQVVFRIRYDRSRDARGCRYVESVSAELIDISKGGGGGAVSISYRYQP